MYFGQRTLSACMKAAIDQPVTTIAVACNRDEPLTFNEDAQPRVTVTPTRPLLKWVPSSKGCRRAGALPHLTGFVRANAVPD